MKKNNKNKFIDYMFIKNFSKISINKICKDNNITSNNVFSGKTSYENYAIVRKRIEIEYLKCLIVGIEEEIKELENEKSNAS